MAENKKNGQWVITLLIGVVSAFITTRGPPFDFLFQFQIRIQLKKALTPRSPPKLIKPDLQTLNVW